MWTLIAIMTFTNSVNNTRTIHCKMDTYRYKQMCLDMLDESNRSSLQNTWLNDEVESKAFRLAKDDEAYPNIKYKCTKQ